MNWPSRHAHSCWQQNKQYVLHTNCNMEAITMNPEQSDLILYYLQYRLLKHISRWESRSQLPWIAGKGLKFYACNMFKCRFFKKPNKACICYAFVCICLLMSCGHLLGKGWPLGSHLWCRIVKLSQIPIDILGQVWCLIVSIPDLCPLSYIDMSSATTVIVA